MNNQNAFHIEHIARTQTPKPIWLRDLVDEGDARGLHLGIIIVRVRFILFLRTLRSLTRAVLFQQEERQYHNSKSGDEEELTKKGLNDDELNEQQHAQSSSKKKRTLNHIKVSKPLSSCGTGSHSSAPVAWSIHSSQQNAPRKPLPMKPKKNPKKNREIFGEIYPSNQCSEGTKRQDVVGEGCAAIRFFFFYSTEHVSKTKLLRQTCLFKLHFLQKHRSDQCGYSAASSRAQVLPHPIDLFVLLFYFLPLSVICVPFSFVIFRFSVPMEPF